MGNGSVAMLTNVVVTMAESPGLMMTMLTMVMVVVVRPLRVCPTCSGYTRRRRWRRRGLLWLARARLLATKLVIFKYQARGGNNLIKTMFTTCSPTL